MSDRDRDRPGPRPRPAPAARPSPRPRVAGSRRDRDDDRPSPSPRSDEAPVEVSLGTPAESPAEGPGHARVESPVEAPVEAAVEAPVGAAARRSRRTVTAESAPPAPRRSWLLPVSLLCLVLLAAGAVGALLYQRFNPPYVDSSVFTAAQENVEALYAYDYRDSEGSVAGKLDALTGELREQYETDLSQGGILDTYEQVSATTRYEVLDIGLQQINGAQDTATLVVFGSYVVESVNSGEQPAPEGSECQVTPEGAQSCTQTVQVRMVQVDEEWKISELTLLTTS